MSQMGGLINARFEAIESRLLPAPRLRPPLAHDAVPVEPAKDQHTVPERQPRKSKKGKTASRGDEKQPAPTKTVQVAEAIQLLRTEELWTEVSRKRSKKKEKVDTISLPTTKTAMGKQKEPKKKSTGLTPPAPLLSGRKPPSQPQRRKIRPPRSAAVVLTLEPEDAIKTEGGEARPRKTLAEILAAAKEHVSIEELGIPSLKAMRAMSGGVVFEVPGPNSVTDANRFADHLRTALTGKGVRVSRPTKTEEIRIDGLDDSVTPTELARAIAKVCGCGPEELKIGDIRQSPAGLCTAWCRCPATVAKQLADAGKLVVGWVTARVTPLDPRPLHCYRCLEPGHVGGKCTSNVNRGCRCYRCGGKGHMARTCVLELKRPLCADKDRPHNHRFGSKLCLQTSKKPSPTGGRKAEARAAGERVTGRTVPPTVS